MTEIFHAYKLNYECEADYGPGNGALIFTAENDSDAVASALRWMQGRTKIIPQVFKKFTYFEISPYEIGPIDEKGGMHNGRSFRLMEWSRCRAGVDMETYCEWKIAEYTKKGR
jgi:hypothetical protein